MLLALYWALCHQPRVCKAELTALRGDHANSVLWWHVHGRDQMGKTHWIGVYPGKDRDKAMRDCMAFLSNADGPERKKSRH